MAFLMQTAVILSFWTTTLSAQLTDTMNVTEGKNATFKCDLSDSNFTLPEWRIPSAILFDQDSLEINVNLTDSFKTRVTRSSNQRDLFISDVHLTDAGEYQCSYAGKGNQTSMLSVSLQPNATKENEESHKRIQIIGQSALFLAPCAIIAIVFMKCRNRLRRRTEPLQNNGEIFKTGLSDREGDIHSDVDFVCSLRREARDVSVDWFHNDNVLSNDWEKHILQEDGRERKLTVRNINRNDEGSYTVSAGTKSKTARLVVNKVLNVHLYRLPDQEFGIDIHESNGNIYVNEIKHGSSADESGKLQKGDRILKLNKEFMSIDDMQQMLNRSKHIELEVTQDKT